MSVRTLGLTGLHSAPFRAAGRPMACGPSIRGLFQLSRLSTSTPRYDATNTAVGSKPLPKTIKISVEKGNEILNNQRHNRPVAPHLGVYKIQQTWFGSSAWMRITGCTLSGAAYVYFISYLVAPAFGLGFDSSSLVASFAGLPMLAQNSIKFGLVFPFVFHSFNGLKHLVYDMGIGYKKSTIKRADFYLWGFSLPLALGMVFLL